MIEVHVTTQVLKNNDIKQFTDFCRMNNFKPIIIELNTGETQQQPMISKVIDFTDKNTIHNKLENIKKTFVDNGYSINRVKIEVPLEYSYLAEELFPNYRGRYGEWHGKIRYNSLEDLNRLKSDTRFKISRNQLKGEDKTRFITYRHYTYLDQFENYVANIKNSIKWKGFEIIKEEFEYCIYDSNKKVDSGWIDTPEITDGNYLNIMAFDSLIKRQAELKNQLILKGSLVTRQFIRKKEIRRAQDIDFVVSGNTDEYPFELFSNWITEMTEKNTDDDIRFRSFKENEFWRRREYAMSDDFPTTSTDLTVIYKDGLLKNIGIDISWNLPIYDDVEIISYDCYDGSKFDVKVVGFRLQISWKLHQCIVRPRGKDFLDVILLLEDNYLSDYDIEKIKEYLNEECKRDNISSSLLNRYANGLISKWMYEIDYKDDYSSSESKFGILFGNECTTKNLDRIYQNIDIPSIATLIEEFENTLIENKLII